MTDQVPIEELQRLSVQDDKPLQHEAEAEPETSPPQPDVYDDDGHNDPVYAPLDDMKAEIRLLNILPDHEVRTIERLCVSNLSVHC
jgi:hypothetical protein